MNAIRINYVAALCLIVISIGAAANDTNEESGKSGNAVFSITTVNSLDAAKEFVDAGKDRMPNETGQIVLDFMSGKENVSGFQMDIQLKTKGSSKINLESCGVGLPVSHQAACREISPGLVRILVDSPTNAVLNTTNVGFLEVISSSYSAIIVPDSVVAGDPTGSKVQTEIL